MEKEKLLTVKQAAELLQVTETSIRHWLSQGKLKGSKMGSRWRIKREELDRFINQDQEV